MDNYTLTATVEGPHDEVVDAVRTALDQQGFGILTEIDLTAALKEKLGVDIAPQVVLGACRPALAYEAIRADPSIAALLPCNVVVRAKDDTTSVVEAFDPQAMSRLSDASSLKEIAEDAKRRLHAALATLTSR